MNIRFFQNFHLSFPSAPLSLSLSLSLSSFLFVFCFFENFTSLDIFFISIPSFIYLHNFVFFFFTFLFSFSSLFSSLIVHSVFSSPYLLLFFSPFCFSSHILTPQYHAIQHEVSHNDFLFNEISLFASAVTSRAELISQIRPTLPYKNIISPFKEHFFKEYFSPVFLRLVYLKSLSREGLHLDLLDKYV